LGRQLPLLGFIVLGTLAGSPSNAQVPDFIGTEVFNGGPNYGQYGLSAVGGFKQYRAQAANSSGSAKWEFYTGNYFFNWRPYGTGGNPPLAGFNQFVAPVGGTASALRNDNFGGVTGFLPASTAGRYYTFNVTQNNNQNQNMAVLETAYNPVAVAAISQSPTAPSFGRAVTVTATTSATPDAAEYLYLRYSMNGFAASTIVPMMGSGTTWTAAIPGQAGGTAVAYYVFTSPNASGATGGGAVTPATADMLTLTLNNNGGANYSYTTSRALEGTYTIDPAGGGLPNFTTMNDAFSALLSFNGGSVSGPTVFQVKDGATFTSNNLTLTAVTGASATNTVTFRRDNSGVVRPLVQSTTSVNPGQQDAIIKLDGADYVTFDGIDVAENPGVVGAPAGNNVLMEYGYALFRSNGGDGCQYNAIRNCAVTLNRNNPNRTVGIWLANTDLGGFGVTATSAAGANSFNVLAGNTVINSQWGIAAGGSGLPDQSNQLGSLTGPGNTISTVAAFGILAFIQDGLAIGSNTVSFATGNTGLQYGIVVGERTAGAVVARNTVRTLKYIGNGGQGVRGISLDPGPIAANIVVRNNAVSDLTADGNDSSNDTQVMGIGVLSGTGYAIHNNSVQLNGDRADNVFGGKVSAALFVASTAGGLDVRNNVLSNVQTTSDIDAGQTGTNYAVYAQAATGNPFSAIDYNLYDLRSGAAARGILAASPQFVGRLAGTDVATLAQWQAATGQDRSSMVTAGPNTAGFTSALNLAPNPADASAYALNSTGVQISDVATDLNGTPRPTTVPAGAPDLGAYEFVPTVEPNPLEVTGPYAPGGTQSFFFNGRPVASITYGTAGTLPATLTARYSPGAVPPPPYTPATTPRFANATYQFTDSGDGVGFSYALVLNYEPALLGTIASEAAQRVSLRNPAGTGYGTYFGTIVNTAARTLDVQYTLTRFGRFAISDAAAPLPVELARFEAVREGADAALSWATASEKSNRGFAVEVSTGGEFRELAFVAGAGSSSAPRAYAFRDREASKAGPRYYRLRQLDFDGTASFSPVRALAFGEGSGPSALSAAPNPFDGGFVLAVQARTAQPGAVLTLFDAAGRPVARRVLDVPAGRSQLPVAGLEGLAPGLYVGQLTLEGQTLHLKVVKR